MSSPRFSLVIPCYNGAGYIVRCLSSIAKQTFQLDNVEVIFVDDGSADGSAVIAERFETDFPVFKVVKNPSPSGPGGARNRGVKEATGEYLFLIDVDDLIPPESLSSIDNAISGNESPDVILFPYRILRPESSCRAKGIVNPPIEDIKQAAFSAVGPWSCVFKRSLYLPMPENTLSEDTAWHFMMFDQFNTFAKVKGDEPCYVYDRTNATAITDTVEWAGMHSMTLEQLALEDRAIREGKRDQWISDVIRNLANMYDVRRRLTKPWVKAAWAERFRHEVSNIMTGHFVH